MRSTVDPWRLASATMSLAATLFFSLSCPATARQGDLQAEPLHGIRHGEGPGGRSGRGAEIPADYAAPCGKCHTPCEDGRVHEGLEPVAPRAGVDLPLTADGLATCLTCHEPHSRGTAPGDKLLRVSNLQRGLCLVCHRQESDKEPRIRIVSPPERSVVQEEHLALIGKSSGLAEETLSVRLNGAQFHLRVKGGEFSTWLRLEDGVNRIEISQAERVLWEGEVFRGVSSSSGYGRQMSGHRTESREQCRECHDGSGGRITGAANDTSTLCYGCHDRFEGKRYLHGPLAVGACLACHDPHGGFGAAHLREERTLLCGNCHSGRDTAATKVCNASGKACADCHDPHQSDSRYLLKGPQYTLRGGTVPAAQ